MAALQGPWPPSGNEWYGKGRDKPYPYPEPHLLFFRPPGTALADLEGGGHFRASGFNPWRSHANRTNKPMTTTHDTKQTALSPSQLQTLQAAVDRIIPADDYPSGWEAGVGDFMARLMTCEPKYLPVYQSGLEALEAEAHTQGASFADMKAATQDALLAKIEEGEVQAEWPVEPVAFFRLLVQQAMEGFYADPGNGGNKGGVAWDMIGYRVTA